MQADYVSGTVAETNPTTAIWWEPIAIAAVALLAVMGRWWSGWTAPLGFDETFSAVIATQPDAASLIDWCLNEIGGPVYYGLLWLWAHLFGDGIASLRAFSLVASLAAPLVIVRWGPEDRHLRLLWAGLLALWLPGLEMATTARSYALLTLLGTAQAILFLRVMRRPERGRALAWTTVSVLTVLTHYHAALLAGVQGLILLGVHRRAAVRCWPALIPLVPMAGWMALHLPLLFHFGARGAWYPPFRLAQLAGASASFFGSVPLGGTAIVGAGLAIAAHGRSWRLSDLDRADRALAASGLAALALMLALAMARPSFAWRYVAPLAPAILFAVALGLDRARRHSAFVPIGAILACGALVAARIVEQIVQPRDDIRYALNLDEPSAWLGERPPHRLGFLWDSPTGSMSDPGRIAQVVGYPLNRRHHVVPVLPFRVVPGEAPSVTVARLVDQAKFDALIWLADATVPGTMQRPDPPTLQRRGWTCREFGRMPVVMLTCRAAGPQSR